MRAERYNFDENQLKPYFEMHSVLTKGVFFAAGKLYGLTFKQRTDLPVYTSDMLVYDVFNEDGTQLAIFTLDPYARSNKRGGAWANAYVGQSGLLNRKPVIANNLNIPKPEAGQPTLTACPEQLVCEGYTCAAESLARLESPVQETWAAFVAATAPGSNC